LTEFRGGGSLKLGDKMFYRFVTFALAILTISFGLWAIKKLDERKKRPKPQDDDTPATSIYYGNFEIHDIGINVALVLGGASLIILWIYII